MNPLSTLSQQDEFVYQNQEKIQNLEKGEGKSSGKNNQKLKGW